jgi:AcrR family transcriptional regulator
MLYRMASPPERRRAARHQQSLPVDTAAPRRGPSAGRKKPITVDAIIETALGLVERDGYSALTMRRVAAALETGSASLYAHVVNKQDLDDLLIGRLCAEIELPEPDARAWRGQIIGVCDQIREQYRRYPGISLAALAVVPTNVETLRVSEGMLGILLAGGIAPKTAVWAIDALLLYVNAFCLEGALRERTTDPDGPDAGTDADDLRRRFAGLPDTFAHTKHYAAEVTSGTALDRFGFTLNLIMDGLSGRT